MSSAVTAPSRAPSRRQALRRWRDLVVMLAWRDIRIKYKQSVMGFLWAILMPGLVVGATRRRGRRGCRSGGCAGVLEGGKHVEAVSEALREVRPMPAAQASATPTATVSATSAMRISTTAAS